MIIMESFCRELPKIELHAHLNGSFSSSTMLQLKRYHADRGLFDPTDVFIEDFQIGAGDIGTFSDCFQKFNIAHTLTSTPEALALATSLTLKEFQDDGCCYIELRSTPRNTPYMTKEQYIESIIRTIQNSSQHISIISKLIISINRASSILEAEEIAYLAVKYYKKYPDIVVGIELSGNPTFGRFMDFVPTLKMARDAGMKVTLHCGEVCNPDEIIEMINFKPERIGHGVCIHPSYGGTEETWKALCKSKIPVEVCLTSNVRSKSTPSYDSHHFKELHSAGIPTIICTDDKGVFATSLSQEYLLCAETFNLSRSQLVGMLRNGSNYIFAENQLTIVKKKIDKYYNGVVENKGVAEKV